jgi:hypothetical protein
VGFLKNGLNVRFNGVCVCGQGIEVAVTAFFNTKRNVDVKTSHLTPPDN